MLLANTRLVTHRWAVHHLISSFLLEETHHHTPSPHVATESTSRVTQHQRSKAKTDTKQQHSSGLALCSHVTLDVIPHQWLQPRTLSGAPSHGEAVDGTAEAADQQVARRTTSRTDTSHYNRLQHVSRSHTTATPPMVKCTAHRTFFASYPGATTATLSEHSPKREAWTMVTERQRPVCLLAVWRVSQQS